MIREQGKNLEKYMRNLDEELLVEKLYDDVCQEFSYVHEMKLTDDQTHQLITDIVYFTVAKVIKTRNEY